MIKILFHYLGWLFPNLLAVWAYQLWFSTRRFDLPKREQTIRDIAEQSQFTTHDHQLAVYQWGDTAKPCVLLVHGWNGRGTQMAGFVAPLIERGYRVLTLDLPGHGDSSGHSTNLFECAELLNKIHDEHGPYEGIIAHSFGVLCTLKALQRYAYPCPVVCISSPVSLQFLLDKFMDYLWASDRLRQAFINHLKRVFGDDVLQQGSAEQMVSHIKNAGLMIHDEGDRGVPFKDTELLARSWPTARVLATQGLGHVRILRSKRVIGAAVDFISEQHKNSTR